MNNLKDAVLFPASSDRRAARDRGAGGTLHSSSFDEREPEPPPARLMQPWAQAAWRLTRARL